MIVRMPEDFACLVRKKSGTNRRIIYAKFPGHPNACLYTGFFVEMPKEESQKHYCSTKLKVHSSSAFALGNCHLSSVLISAF